MRHQSVQIESPCEIINITPINPLISKCQIKVCYVSDEPNRNRSVITKDVARQIANSLPGSPIVGYYNEATGDFEEHNRTITISNGKFVLEDSTRPYGFVDLGAKVWFQKYRDDNKEIREYMVTEGYLWTGQYPECKRIIEKGNNQSLEFDNDLLDGNWTKPDNNGPKLFIVNEAVISKLCILGDDCEPCFEGSNITSAPIEFSLSDDFRHRYYSMMKELNSLKQQLKTEKGGTTQVFTKYAVTVGDDLFTQLYSNISNEQNSLYSVLADGDQLFAVAQNREDNKFYRANFSLNEGKVENLSELEEMKDFEPSEDFQFSLSEVEAFEATYKKKEEKEEDKKDQEDNPNSDKTTEGETPEDDKSEEDKDKKKKKDKYVLEEIPEYVELSNKYSALETDFNNLKNELSELRQFKLDQERQQKEEMINSFYMLSDEDKQNVKDNIDTYSLKDIEAELSILCVRNKVNFNADDEHKEAPTTFNFNGVEFDDLSTPAWVKAAMEVEKEIK